MLFSPEVATGRVTAGITGMLAPEAALRKLLEGSGLVVTRSEGGMVLVHLPGPGQRPVPAVDRAASASALDLEATGDASRRIEDVVVTARKMAEPLQTVPLAVFAFEPRELTRAGQGGLVDVAQLAPGVVFQSYAASFDASPTIRGLTQFKITSPVSNVSTVVDGVYVPRQYAIDLGLVDVARVEIAKGPQSALYGSNSFAGVIAYTLVQPPARPEAEITATVGSGARQHRHLAFGGPLLDDRLDLRVNYARSSYGGTWRNLWPADARGRVQSLGGHDNETYGATARILSGSPVELSVAWFRLDRHEDLKPAFSLTSFDPSSRFNCRPFICGTLSWDPTVYRSADSRRLPGLVQPPQPGFHSRLDFLSGRIAAHFTEELNAYYLYGHVDSFATQVSTPTDDPLNPCYGYNFNTMYATGCTRGAPTCEYEYGYWNMSTKEVGTNTLASHELRFEWKRGPWNLMAGLYRSQVADFYQFANGSFAAGVPLSDGSSSPFDFANFGYPLVGQRLVTRTTAHFGRAAYSFEPSRITVSVELRHQSDALHGIDTTTRSIVDAPESALLRRHTRFEQTTPRFTVSHFAAPGRLVYASAAKGVKQGGFNPPAPGGRQVSVELQAFAPEQNWTYELGVKNTLLDGHAVFSADVFFVRWTNLQTQAEPANVPGAHVANIIVNRGGAISRGVETEGRLVAPGGVELGYSVAYVDSRFQRGAVSGQVFGLCDGIVCPRDGAIGGRQLPRYSKVQATARASWTRQVTEGWTLNLAGELTYQSLQQADETNVTQIPSRSLVNLSTGLAASRWDATLWARNVLNRRYVADAYYIPSPALHAVAYTPSLGELATYGLTLRARFE